MYRRDAHGLIKHIDFLIVDILACELSFMLAFILRQGGTPLSLMHGLFVQGSDDYNSDLYRVFFFGIIVLTILDMSVSRGYHGILKRDFLAELKNALFLSFALTTETVGFLFVFKVSAEFSRLVLFYFFIIASISLIFLRQIYKTILKSFLKKDGYHRRHIVIMAKVDELSDIVSRFEKYQPDVRISGIITLGEKIEEKDSCGLEVRAVGLSEVTEYLVKNWVDGVFISSGYRNPLLGKFLESCDVMGITTHRAVYFPELSSGQKTVEHIAGDAVITESVRIIEPELLFVKRAFDIIGSLIGLLFCGIFLIVFAIPGIFKNDPGPVFYGQKRVGKNGRVFTMYKFRSMYQDADERKAELSEQNEMHGAMFKMEHDPRIIGSGPDGTRHGYGWFIRKYSIDEFPQFLNVFLGQMSLVGTRPPTVEEWQEYEAHHRMRLSVRPGITGVWQTSGRNAVSDFETVVKMDISYINDFSLGNDLRIIGKTIKQVIHGDGGQ